MRAANNLAVGKRDGAGKTRTDSLSENKGERWVSVKEELWIDIHTATPEQMAMALGQERNKILAQLCQIKNDLDHYNANRNKDGKPLLFAFDFTEDIAEYVASGFDRRWLNPEREFVLHGVTIGPVTNNPPITVTSPQAKDGKLIAMRASKE